VYLLVSSYTCGLGALSAERRRPARFLIFTSPPHSYSVGFSFIEATEFAHGQDGRGPPARPFLSAFFTLVGSAASTSPTV
jgi:heme/copper-type cytochrome/quinol oxidase subunit 3